MELELVCATPDGASTAVVVTAPDGAPVGPVRLALQTYFGADDGPLYAGFARMPDTASPATRELVHGGALVHGAALGLGHPVLPVTSGDAPLVDSGEYEVAVVGGLHGGPAIPLRPGEWRCLGRRRDADLVLTDPQTSREHAWVSMDHTGVVRVTDAGSRNGVRLRGRPTEGTAIVGADTFDLGETVVGVRVRTVADARTALDGTGSALLDRPHRSMWSGAGALDPAAIVALGCGPSARLWERRRGDADFLLTRLGLADDPPAYDRPVTLPLAGRILGVAGTPRPALLATARAMVAQVAAVHAPDDLRLVVITHPDRARDWEWASWLPHIRPITGLASCRRLLAVDLEQARARLTDLRTLVRARAASTEQHPAVLVVVDDTRPLQGLPQFTELLESGPAVGISVLCLAAEPRSLPDACWTTLVTSTPLGTRAVLRRPDAPPVRDVLLDGLTAHHATRLARAMAPLRLARSGGVPESVRFTELTGLPLADHPDADAGLGDRYRAAMPGHRRPTVPLPPWPVGRAMLSTSQPSPTTVHTARGDRSREFPPDRAATGLVAVRARRLAELGQPMPTSSGDHNDLTAVVAAIMAADERTPRPVGTRT